MRYEYDLSTGDITELPDLEPVQAEPLSAQAQIATIESTITQRRLREAVLGIDGGWLAAKVAEIAALRSQV